MSIHDCRTISAAPRFDAPSTTSKVRGGGWSSMVCFVISGSLNDDSSIGTGSLYWMVDCGVDWGDYIVTSIAVPRLAEFVTRWTEVWIR